MGGLITEGTAFLGGLVAGELGEEEAGATKLTSNFIPRSQCPAVPQIPLLRGVKEDDCLAAVKTFQRTARLA